MIAQVYFPFFDSRFCREDADETASRLAPRWLYLDPPPPLESVGRLGKIVKHIPPRPDARCQVGDIIQIAEAQMDSASDRMELQSIDLMADQYGHARLTISLVVHPNPGRGTLAELVSVVMNASVTVRHPDRRSQYETLATARSWLADLYGRESSRSTPVDQRQYDLDWISVGRPFVILTNTRREQVEVGDAQFALPIVGTQVPDAVRFLPWQDDDGMAMPVWYLDAPRGGDAWRQPAEALADITARYEELFLCFYLRTRAGGDIRARNFAASLQRHIDGLTGSLRGRTKPRHGISQRAAVQFLSNFDTSVLQSRRSDEYESALVGRAKRELESSLYDKDQAKAQATNFFYYVYWEDKRIMSQANYGGTGNLFNFGVMTDSTIAITNNMLAEAKASPDLKQKLEDLRGPVIAAAKALPEAEAKSLLKDYETFTETALRENPPKPLVNALGQQLVEVTKKIAELATPVATIVGAVLKLFV